MAEKEDLALLFCHLLRKIKHMTKGNAKREFFEVVTRSNVFMRHSGVSRLTERRSRLRYGIRPAKSGIVPSLAREYSCWQGVQKV